MNPALCGYISESKWILIHIRTLVMEAELVFETLGYLNHFMWLYEQDFTELI
jgi:hypothetical protein